MNFNDFKKDKRVETATVQDMPVVLTEVDVEEMALAIAASVNQSFLENLINPIALEVNAFANFIRVYSDIEIPEDATNSNIYDTLHCEDLYNTDLFDEFYAGVEYYREARERQLYSFSGVLKTLMEELPKNAEEVARIVENFDSSKLKEIQNLATKAGEVLSAE